MGVDGSFLVDSVGEVLRIRNAIGTGPEAWSKEQDGGSQRKLDKHVNAGGEKREMEVEMV